MFVSVVQDLYEDDKVVRYAVGVTDGSKVGVGLHQEWLIFAVMMDSSMKSCRSLWTTMTAGHIVICDLVRAWSSWKRAWKGGGMLWRVEQ